MRILFRSNASLYNGKMRGPKVSIKPHSDEAGWNGASACRGEGSSAVAVAVVSLFLRFGCGRSIFDVSKGESRIPADNGSGLWSLCISQ